ncbi:dephospho-CoA kinase [Cloacibacillus sp. An23]|uniref:dephospho-CoA kinase n=1 Tax=Cloacibacillus sp. An23 TaxID=1965591 RepID=UPI001302AC36|nr:dephospho-CoA kinase [Cloacibacillus sp. An23]
MPTIGLTGDVGAGKSTLCSVWREMGANVIDADTVARSMWDVPEVRVEAEKRWGAGFFDEPDHRTLWAKIAAKIFNDAGEYKFASALIHKRTGEELKKLARESKGWTIVEIPLLYEGGHDEWLDYVVYAAAPFDKRVARNAKRNWDAGEVARREAKLTPSYEKMAKADFVLVNDGTEEEWKQKARELGEKLKKL